MGRIWRGAASAAAAILLLGLAGCAHRSGLYPLDAADVRSHPFSDEDEFRGAAAAVRQSLEYYRRLPADAVFHYRDLVYTRAEMESSMYLFLDIVEGVGSDADRIALLREKFDFFESRNEKGAAFFTGYYEPVIDGSRTRGAAFSAPVYAVPDDLVTIDLTAFSASGLLPDDLENEKLRGKLAGRTVVPYDDRVEITSRDSLAGRASVLVYLPNQIELSFLQIQGSGVVKLEDGSLLRLNYAGQNGHPYRALGRFLLDRIPLEEMSLQSIKAYLYAHPDEARAILDLNPSYTFFRLTDAGPLGLIEVPLTAGRSVAMDARLFPRGGLVYFETSYPASSRPASGSAPFSRFGVMQDTGGAIRGHGRADIFWGRGDKAEMIAGPMRETGRMYLLVARKEELRTLSVSP